MKILHVIRGLANSSGTTHIVIPLSEEQARQGDEVTIFHVQKGNQPPLAPDPKLVESCCFPLSLPFNNPGVSWAFGRALAKRISEFDVLHIHAIWNFPTYYSMRTALQQNIPYIVAPQGSLEPWAFEHGSWYRRYYARRIEGPLLARASAMQALTEAEAAQFRAFGLATQTAIIPNGVSHDWLKNKSGNLAEQLGLPTASKTLLFLSRIHKKKGLDILLRAFAKVSSLLPKVMLVVAGNDAGSGYLQTMQALAKSLALESRCLFIGEVAGDKKRATFLGADAFVLTSHSEGLPVAVVEAMASGLPVLITPGCNIPEVQHHAAGIIVEPTVDAVAEGILVLYKDDRQGGEYGKQGQALVREKFTWPQIAQQTTQTYKGLIASQAHV